LADCVEEQAARTNASQSAGTNRKEYFLKFIKRVQPCRLEDYYRRSFEAVAIGFAPYAAAAW
jgi:hypothetical protein